jgi:hypothetical protein
VAQLQDILEDRAECINMAVHEYGHDQMLIYFQEEGIKYSPDIVILGFVRRDMSRNLLEFRDFAKPRFSIKNGQLTLLKPNVPTIEEIMIQEFFRLHVLDFMQILIHSSPWWRSLHDDKAERITVALLDEIHAACRSINAEFILLNLPMQADLQDPTTPRGEKFIIDYTRSRGLMLLNPKQHLRSNLDDGTEYKMDGHYGILMHHDIARFLAKRLEPVSNVKK